MLAPWGSIAVELGDTYAGSGGAGGDYNAGGLRDGKASSTGRRLHARVQRRPLAGQKRQPGRLAARQVARPHPQLYAIALAYGINPLTGQPSPAGRWRVRNVIVWHRPNPAVGALGDKVRPSTSYIVVATRATSGGST